jgi:hypothetical protein
VAVEPVSCAVDPTEREATRAKYSRLITVTHPGLSSDFDPPEKKKFHARKSGLFPVDIALTMCVLACD